MKNRVFYLFQQKKKIEIYKRDLQNLKLNNSNQEQENIEMMNYLFECNKEELKYVK